MCLGGKNMEVKCHFHHIISGELTISMNFTVDVDLDHMPEVVSMGFLHCKVTPTSPAPFPHCALWKEVTVQHTLNSGNLYSPPRGQSIYISYLSFFCIASSPLIHLFIQ